MNPFWGNHVWADTSIMSHNYHFLYYGENNYSPSNFQVYNTILLTIVTVLYIRSPELFIWWLSVGTPLTNLPPQSCGMSVGVHTTLLFLWVWLFQVSHMWYVRLFLGDLVFSSFGYDPEVRLLGHMVVLFLTFCGPSIVFSTVAILADTATNSAQGYFFSTSLPPLTILSFFWMIAVLTGVSEISLWFWFAFSRLISDDEMSFHVFLGHLYVFSGKQYLFSSSAHFLIRLCFSYWWIHCLMDWSTIDPSIVHIFWMLSVWRYQVYDLQVSSILYLIRYIFLQISSPIL